MTFEPKRILHFGRRAEQAAAQYYQEQGFSVVDRNHRYRRAEIDLIVEKEDLLVFVEVKARSSSQFGFPENFVSPAQQARVCVVAEHYIAERNWHMRIRFDIIAIVKQAEGWQLTHFEDAFG